MGERNVEAQNIQLNQPDLTGRDRIVKNVLSSWAGHMVFVIAGFIMPRLIDHNVGQSGLGVWDFGWSLITYFAFIQAGIASSVNRYIAKYRALGDINELRCTFSSVLCFQFFAGFIALILTIFATWFVPIVFRDRLGPYIGDARWVVLFLGLSMSLEVAVSPSSGVITGSHRWDLHNGLNAGCHGMIVLAWIAALLMGGGLRSLALINFIGVVFTEMARLKLAFKVCPKLMFQLRFVHWANIRKMLNFGGKSILTTASRVLLYQTSNLLVVSFLGPVALAMYSRPGGLVRHAMTFVNKFAFVLTPTASCLHAQGQKKELSNLLISTTMCAAYIAIPMVAFLTIMGSPILAFWMGSKYQQGPVLAVLALGHLMTMIQQPVWNILAGMNVHGRLGVANLITAVVACVFAILALGVFQWGLMGAALSITVPISFTYGIYVPNYACRHLDMSCREYLVSAIRKPTCCCLPFVVCLILARYFFMDQPKLSLLIAVLAGGIALTSVYWFYVLPDNLKLKISKKFQRKSMQRKKDVVSTELAGELTNQ